MIIGKDITLHFGQQVVFDNVAFTFGQQQKIGLAGRNGAGKSTLLKVIAGQQKLDAGGVSIERDKKIAYMPQEVVLLSAKTVLDEAFAVFDDIFALKKERDELEQYFASHDAAEADPVKVERYAHVIHECSQVDIGSLETQTKKMLQGLGIGPDRWTMSVDQLSVGWKMRLVLAKLLLQNADFYLFDEPTNHLDIVTKDWFFDFLRSSKAGFLLVTHDRYFLDNACDYIYELNRGKGTMFTGNYDAFLTHKENESAIKEAAYIQQQKDIKRKTETINRFRASASRASMAQSMIKALDKIERIEPDPKQGAVHFSFAPVVRAGEVVLHVENVSKSFGDKQLFKDVTFQIFREDRVALVAANGVGKTTLLNILMNKLNADHGAMRLGHNVTPAYFEQDQERSLNKQKTILDEIEDSCKTSEARGRARAFLGAFLFPGDDVHKRIAVLSGGEKNRVAMVKVLLTQANFLILDEPTNHLDLISKEVLLQALQQYKGTLLFVSHDRSFLNSLATRIVELTPTGVRSYKGNYEAYLYYKQQETAQSAPAQAAKPVAQKEVKQEPQGKEAYEARKKRNSLERKIEKLEEEIAALNVKLGELEWGSDEHQRADARVKQIQKSLTETYAEWEKLGGTKD